MRVFCLTTLYSLFFICAESIRQTGMYNAFTRHIEPELFACLEELNIKFHAYNPLCGGVLTGTYSFDGNVEQGSRFDPNAKQGAR